MLQVGRRAVPNDALHDVVCWSAEITLFFDSSAFYSSPAATHPTVKRVLWVKTVAVSHLSVLV